MPSHRLDVPLHVVYIYKCFLFFFLLAQGFQTTTGFITQRQDPDNSAQVPGQCFSKNSLIYSVATVQWVFFTGEKFFRNQIYCITGNFHGLNFCESKFLLTIYQVRSI